MFDNIDDLITKDKKEFKEKKSLVGRPKKHDFEKKDKRIVSYLTYSELTDLEDLARENEITVSQIARKIIIDFIKENVHKKRSTS